MIINHKQLVNANWQLGIGDYTVSTQYALQSTHIRQFINPLQRGRRVQAAVAAQNWWKFHLLCGCRLAVSPHCLKYIMVPYYNGIALPGTDTIVTLVTRQYYHYYLFSMGSTTRPHIEQSWNKGGLSYGQSVNCRFCWNIEHKYYYEFIIFIIIIWVYVFITIIL